MFDFSFSELLVILIIALIVLGPEKLPKFAHFVGSTINKIRKFTQQVQDEFVQQTKETELEALSQSFKNSVQELHQQVKQEISSLEGSVQDLVEKSQIDFDQNITSVQNPPNYLDQGLLPHYSNFNHKYRQNQRKKYGRPRTQTLPRKFRRPNSLIK